MTDLFDGAHDSVQLQSALEEFLNVNSVEEMQALLERYPFMETVEFDNSVQRLIEHAIRVGEAEAVMHLQEGMDLLNRALRDSHASPLERAVEDFLYAFDDEEATEVFHQHSDMLRSQEAASLLFAVEAGDPESAALLESRQHLWRELSRKPSPS